MSTRWFGSLQNRLAEAAKMPEPVVGMGATELMYSDREAYEVIEVMDERHITVRSMKSTMKPGTDWLDQEYDYASDPNGTIAHLFRKKNGQWVERYPGGTYGNGFALGYMEKYRDPSF